MILCLCRKTARGRLADERRRAVTPTPLVQSLVLGQLNCRRLWSRDGSIHDGFMALVSCFDQLGLQVLCVQETQSPKMLSSSGLAATVAMRVSCSTLPLWRPLSLGPLTHSPFSGASSRALFVSARSMRRMLAFPLTLTSLAASVHRVSQLHSGTPAFSCRGLQHLVPLFPARSFTTG